MTRAELQRRRARVARVNAKRPRRAPVEVEIVRAGSSDGWRRIGEVLLELLDTPPTPDDGR